MRKLSIKKAGAVCLALLTAAAALAGCGAGEAGTAKDSTGVSAPSDPQTPFP